jgi:hypothetical protein
MSIPKDWLVGPTELAEVEEDLAENGAPDLWLRQWRSLRNQFEQGDELWKYSGVELEPWVSDVEQQTPAFVPIRDGYGFALVRDGEILDWIEAPP